MNPMNAVVQALIPYFTIHDHYIGPVPIHPFGLLVATGIIIGHSIAMRRAKVLGLDELRFEKLVFWTVATGIVLSHMLDTIFYHPDVLRENPLELILIHHGLSSFGGFFGAAIGYFVYSRKHKIDVWRSADAIAYGLPVGWLFGRMGCSVVHDHPGKASTGMFAVNFPGHPHYDLGVLELMLTPLLIAAVLIVGRITKKPGAVIATLALMYPPIRFPLDYLRLDDPQGGDLRYFGFTPGQYACVICFCLGLYIVYRTWNLPPEEPPKPEKKSDPKGNKPRAKSKSARSGDQDAPAAAS